MNKFPLVATCVISLTLAACQEKPTTTCMGDTRLNSAEPWMSDYDKFFILTDFSKYVGMSVSAMEKELAYKYSKRSAVTKPNNELIGLTYTYTNNYSITVSFNKLNHITYNEKRKHWDFSKLGKETVSGINVSHQGGGNFYFCKDFGEIRL